MKEDETNNRSLVLPSIDSESYPTVNLFPKLFLWYIQVLVPLIFSTFSLTIYTIQKQLEETVQPLGYLLVEEQQAMVLMIIICHPF